MFFKIKQKLIRSLICPEFLLNAKPQSAIKQDLIAATPIPQNLQSINTVEELTGECTFAL